MIKPKYSVCMDEHELTDALRLLAGIINKIKVLATDSNDLTESQIDDLKYYYKDLQHAGGHLTKKDISSFTCITGCAQSVLRRISAIKHNNIASELAEGLNELLMWARSCEVNPFARFL